MSRASVLRERTRSRAGGGNGGGDSQSLDSLLDTMANVVGILIVVLAVVQLTVGDAMDRIHLLESDEGRSLAARELELEDALAAFGPEPTADAEAARRLRAQARALAADARAARARAGLTEASTTAAELAREIRQLESANADKRRRLSALQIRASERERDEQRGAHELRLPDPRPAPPGTREVVLLVRHERVLEPRLDLLRKLLGEEIRAWLEQGHSFRFPEARALIEQLRVRDLGNESMRWRIHDENGQPVAHLEWRSRAAGTSLGALDDPGSDFALALANLDPKAHYLSFWVWGNSFESYLEARRVAEGAGFSVGWRAFEPEQPLVFRLGPERRHVAPVD